MKKLCLFIMLALLMSATTIAQEPLEGEKSQQIIDELKRLTDRAERDRTASYRFIDQLRELITRYDWPWGRQILFDDFQDGDFRSNPAWNSDSNAFWVTRSVGLRTELAPYRDNGRTENQNQSTEEALLGILIEGALGQHQGGGDTAAVNPERADIYSVVPISNAFAMTIQLSSLGRGRQDGSFEWGPYQGRSIDSGYRLVYQGGNRPALKLVRYRSGMSAIIDLYDQGGLLEDGGIHEISWQRAADGLMTVLLDGRQVIQVRDRSYRQGFDGVSMSNRGGEYAVRSIAVFGSN